jgi:hypothetical protein
MTTALEAFCKANPSDKRVVRITKLMNKPIGSMYSWTNLGKQIGQLMREEGL